MSRTGSSGGARDARIAIATVMRPHGQTGVQTHFNAFLEFLQRQGRPGQLLTCFDAPRLLVLPLFGLRRLVEPLSGSLGVWWYRHWHEAMLRVALRRHLRGDEVIYAQCPLSARAALAARCSPAQRVCLVVHFNVSQADEWADKGLIARDGVHFRAIRALEAEVLPRVDALVYVSAFMRDQVQQRIPTVRGLPSRVIPNFVRAPAAPQGRAAQVQGDLISIGTLEPRKNQEYLLHVLAAARDQGCRYTLNLVGDGPAAAAYRSLAQRLGLGDSVRFLGAVPDAASLIRAHRAYVHAARMESQGIVLIEALASGVPVFAPAVGGIPEVFRDGVEGHFWPLEDPQAGARRLIEVLQHPDVHARMAAAASAHFEDCFSADRVAVELVEFLVAGGSGLDIA